MKKILWAVDPFGKDKLFQMKVAKALLQLAKGTGAVVEPVCVLSPDQVRIPAEAFGDNQKHYKLEAERLIQAWVKALKNPSLTAPTLLAQDDYSLRSSVRTLVEYSEKTGADMIGLGTHAKKALHRFFMGSFAETLVLSSTKPLMVVSARQAKPMKTGRVLFPTDFSERSQKAFSAFLSMAKAKKSEVVLYHKVQFEVPPAIYGFDPTPAYDEFLEQDLGRKRATAQSWQAIAKVVGVKTQVHIQEKPGAPVESILAASKKFRCDFIAMASESGAATAVLLGSICRQVIRHAACPVWVLHTK